MELIPNVFTNQSLVFFTGLMVGVSILFIHMFNSHFRGSKGGTTPRENTQENSEYSFPDDSDDMKMVLVVRNDLKMGKGKAAAQCAHGAVIVYEIAAAKQPHVLKKWMQNGQRKIVVKAESEEELLQLAIEARKLALVHAIVRDAGLTQIRSGTQTVLAVGPGPEDLVDKVTAHLKLY